MANKRALGKKEDNDLNLHKKLSSMMTKERYCELLPDDCWWFSQGHELTLHTQLSEIGNSLYSLRVMQYDIEDKAANGTLDEQNAFHEHFFDTGPLSELGIFYEHRPTSCVKAIDLSEEVWKKMDAEWPEIVHRTITILLSKQDNKHISEDALLESLAHLIQEYIYDIFLPRVLLQYLECLIEDDEGWILQPKKMVFDVSKDSFELLLQGTPITVDEDTTPQRVSYGGIVTLEALSKAPLESMHESILAIIPRFDRHQVCITYKDGSVAIDLFEMVDGKNKRVGTASIPIEHGAIPFTLECIIKRKKQEYPLLIRF